MEQENSQNCGLTLDEFIEIESAFDVIFDLICVMKDYCEYNAEHEKICHMLTLLEQIMPQSKIITDKF